MDGYKQRVKQWVEGNRLARFFLLLFLYLRRKVQRFFIRRRNRMKKEFYVSIFEMVEEGSLVVRVPEFQGSFEIDVRSHILFKLLRTKRYEPDLVRLVREYVDPDRDVVDIGANVGLYTVLLSKLISNGSRVLAVEPTPSALKLLRRNLQRNAVIEKVILYEGVATTAAGEYTFHVIDGLEEYSSLGDIVHPDVKGRPYHTISVQGDTVDHLVEKFNLKPGFIKVDVEGSEHLVFEGAVRSIRLHRPVILTELSDTLLSSQGTTSEVVVDLLESCGYEVLDALHPAKPVRKPFVGTILALPR